MKPLSFLFVLQSILILLYTLYVGVQDGWNLFAVFLNDLSTFNWSGQFNFDFLNYLLLTALWIAWRHRFSPTGILLGLLALVLGLLFLAPYLLIQFRKAQFNVQGLLLGSHLTTETD